MKFELNDADQLTLFLQSVRYAFGRRSYAVGDTVDAVIKFWPQLSQRVQDLIKRDLIEAIADDDRSRADGREHHPLGMDMDRQSWDRLLNHIKKSEL
jgi:hypothetical protein